MVHRETMVRDHATRTFTVTKTDSCECDPARADCPYRSSDASGFGAGACSGITGIHEWIEQVPRVRPHVIDGRATAEEWADTEMMQGIYTDVYMDYSEGRLYFLNDWHVNTTGIHAGCFNHFVLSVGRDWIDLNVYDDGHLEVYRNGVAVPDVAEGAYGFGPSVEWTEPHTIFEFSMAVEPMQIDVCSYDPVTESECEKLAHEPTIMSIDPRGGHIRVARVVPPDTIRVLLNSPCGAGEGLCEDGTECRPNESGVSVCAAIPAPPADAGVPDSGPPV